MTVIDPMGNRSYRSRDSMNRLVQVTDALGGVIQFGYDNNGDILTPADKCTGSRCPGVPGSMAVMPVRTQGGEIRGGWIWWKFTAVDLRCRGR